MSRKRKHFSRKPRNLSLDNVNAMMEGPARKQWSLFDLKLVQPLTETQARLFMAHEKNKNICALGTAGTGKTFLAFYLAFQDLLEKNSRYNKIIIVRSAVSTRDVGFVPGTLEDKVSMYEAPYRDICGELFDKFSTYDDMKKANKLIFMPTTFIRGLTWNNSIVIIEEAQNMTFHELNSVMTRVGDSSKVIVTGDAAQTDLVKNKNDTTGIYKFMSIIEHMKYFESIYFNTEDIVRSRFVKDWIIASEKYDNGG